MKQLLEVLGNKQYVIERNEIYKLSGSDRKYFRIYKASDGRIVKNLNTIEKLHAKIGSH